jgi:acetyl-CoA acetyltransferase
MRDVAIVSFAQTHHAREVSDINEVEMLMPLMGEALAGSGIPKDRVDFVCSASSDYLAGQPFSFVMSLDAFGPWPPISESHVDMDGAWALYEAWTKLLTGDADTALVYGYGKSSPGSVRDVLTRQLDPYYVAPLWPDSVALAALQAQALIDAGETDEPALAGVASRSRASAVTNSHAQLRGSVDQGEYLVRPLRVGDCPPVGDGAAARVHRGESDRALAHATSGPCLQQNLVAVLEGDPR